MGALRWRIPYKSSLICLIAEDDKIRISIIIACLNDYEGVRNFLTRALSQTFENVQYVFADGGSNDETLQHLSSVKSSKVAFLSKPDSGIYEAWNNGLELADGDYVAFMGLDDEFSSDDSLSIIARYIYKLRENPHLVYSKAYLFSKKKPSRNFYRGQPWKIMKKQFMAGDQSNFPHPGILHRRDLFEILGGFDQGLKIAGDHDFLMRSILRFGDPHFFDKCTLFKVGLDGVSDELDGRLQGLREVVEVRRKNGLRAYTFRLIYLICKNHIRLFLKF